MADKTVFDLTPLGAQPANTDGFEILRPGAPNVPYYVLYSELKQTGAQIKTAYEAEADTNAFTDAEQTKLAGITAGANALTGNPLSQFAATTSLQLKNTISDETGSGALVFATSPTLVTPLLGVAVATSVNNLTITQPVTTATLTISNNQTLTVSGSATVSGGAHSGTNTGDQTNISGNAATVTTNANLTGPITSVGNATSVAAQTGTGSTFAMQTGPTFTAPLLGTPASGVLTNCTGLPIVAGTTGTLSVARGGTNQAALGTANQVLRTNGAANDTEWATLAGGGDALVANTLDQFADVTQTAGQTLAITASTTLSGGTHSGTNTGDQTNITGNAATVTTNANLTGPITSVGNATTIADAELAAIAGLTSAADRGIHFTGAGTADTHPLTATGRLIAASTSTQDARSNIFPSYVANALEVVRVNAGSTDLEYHPLAFDDLSDVIITTPATGATLIYNGSAWVDGQLDLADADARTGILPHGNLGTGGGASSKFLREDSTWQTVSGSGLTFAQASALVASGAY